jgi:predicted  nucleic acid-binding Zn-ribbon protein
VQTKLNLLRDLQEIDQKISSIEESQQNYRDELADFEADAARIQGMLDQLNDDIAQLQQEEGEIKQEMAKGRDNVERVEKRLPEIQTQKEYVAVLKEIDIAKKTIKELEEQLQAKQQEIAALTEEREEKETALQSIQENAAARGAELDKLLSEAEKMLKQHTGNREKIAAELPKSLLRKYQALFKRRDGQALALASNGACLGCNMQLPPQKFNQLLQVKELETCPHCNRILYIDPES